MGKNGRFFYMKVYFLGAKENFNQKLSDKNRLFRCSANKTEEKARDKNQAEKRISFVPGTGRTS